MGLNLRTWEEQESSGEEENRRPKVREGPSCAGLHSGQVDSIPCLRTITLKAEE